jgi:hypothetical protein
MDSQTHKVIAFGECLCDIPHRARISGIRGGQEAAGRVGEESDFFIEVHDHGVWGGWVWGVGIGESVLGFSRGRYFEVAPKPLEGCDGGSPGHNVFANSEASDALNRRKSHGARKFIAGNLK